MIYLEHCLRRAGVPPPRRVHVILTGGEPWVGADLRAEVLDVFPQAELDEGPPEQGPHPEAGLVIVPLLGSPDFPYQDVAYRDLPLLRTLAAGPLAGSRAHVLLYRARWRQAEVVPAAALGRYARRLAAEKRLAGWVRRWPLGKALTPRP